MAADGGNVCAPAQPPPWTVLVLWSCGIVLRRGLWPDDRGWPAGLSSRRLRHDHPRPAQERRPPGPHTAQSGGAPGLCPPALLGVAWPDPPCHQLARAMDASTRGQRCTILSLSGGGRGWAIPVAWRVVEATRAGAWRPPWGRPLWPLTRQGARRLARACAGRPGRVRPGAVSAPASPGLASLLTAQAPRPLSGVRLRPLSAADAGGQPRGAAVGGPRALLCHPHAATCGHPARARGCGVSRARVAPHRPAADHGRCRVVCVARLERMRLQSQQTRRRAWGTAPDAGARPGGGDLMDRQGRRPGRSRATKAPGEPTPRAAYRPPVGHGATPRALTQLLPTRPAGQPGRALSRAAPADGVHPSRDGWRSAPCLPTAAQSSRREKPTLERGGPGAWHRGAWPPCPSLTRGGFLKIR